MKRLLILLLTAGIFLGCSDSSESLEPTNSFSQSELNALLPPVKTDKTVRAAAASKTYSTVVDPINGGVQTGNSLLVRNDHGISMAIKSLITPGHAATAWWIIFNNPENCAFSPCGGPNFEDLINGENTGLAMLYAGGSVASQKGGISIGAHLKEGQITESVNGVILGQPERTLNDARKAEIHLVIRDHGPKIPGEVNDQIGSWAGGCTIYLPPFTEIPDDVGECADIQASIHMVN